MAGGYLLWLEAIAAAVTSCRGTGFYTVITNNNQACEIAQFKL